MKHTWERYASFSRSEREYLKKMRRKWAWNRVRLLEEIDDVYETNQLGDAYAERMAAMGR